MTATQIPGGPVGGAGDATPDYAIGVCGFGRCGSSMVMQMLAAGGCPVFGTVAPYSLELLGGVAQAWQGPQVDGAVKLLDSALYYGVPPARLWRFVWLDRDETEQARSQLKLLVGIGGAAADELAPDVVERVVASYRRDRPVAMRRLQQCGSVTVMRYERILVDPWRAARTLRRAVWRGLDVAAAAAVVHRRDGKCRPDLAVEITGRPA